MSEDNQTAYQGADTAEVLYKANFVAAGIASLTDDERVAFFQSLFDHYCEHCGRVQGEKMVRCQCWRDE